MSTSAIRGKGPVQAGQPNSVANRFLQAAMGYYKAAPPYVYGGGHSGPQQGYGSVDCSGLVIQSLYKAGVQNPENLVSTADLPGQAVSRDQLKPGDLCYKHGSGTGGHVAIYIGNGKILESYSSGKPPRIRELGNPDEFTDFRRIFTQSGDAVNTAGITVSPATSGSSASTGGVSSTGGDTNAVSGGDSASSLGLASSGGDVGSTIAQGLAQMNAADAQRKQEDGLSSGSTPALPSSGAAASSSSGGQSASGPVGPLTSAIGQAPKNAEPIFKFLVAHGLSPNAAAGIVGNIAQESGGDPESVGSGGNGLIGWTPPLAGAVTGNPQRDLAFQLNAVMDYIKQNGSVADINANANSPAAAAAYFMNHYERPYAPTENSQHRESAANATAQLASQNHWA